MIKIYTYNTSDGFTLIEMVLYATIASLVIAGVSMFLATVLQSRARSTAISEVEGQGIQVMQLITQNIRNASTTSTPSAGSTAASLSLTMLSGYTPVVFSLATGTLQVKEGANAAVSITNTDVTASNLSFTNLGLSSTTGSVQVKFTLTLNNFSPTNGSSYSKTFIDSATVR